MIALFFFPSLVLFIGSNGKNPLCILIVHFFNFFIFLISLPECNRHDMII